MPESKGRHLARFRSSAYSVQSALDASLMRHALDIYSLRMGGPNVRDSLS